VITPALRDDGRDHVVVPHPWSGTGPRYAGQVPAVDERPVNVGSRPHRRPGDSAARVEDFEHRRVVNSCSLPCIRLVLVCTAVGIRSCQRFGGGAAVPAVDGSGGGSVLDGTGQTFADGRMGRADTEPGDVDYFDVASVRLPGRSRPNRPMVNAPRAELTDLEPVFIKGRRQGTAARRGPRPGRAIGEMRRRRPSRPVRGDAAPVQIMAGRAPGADDADARLADRLRLAA
jgi:hypothetical protein